MESHVSGASTPQGLLGELRQALLAVYVGNPHFTPAEQLLANHQAHELEGEQELAHWLRAARLDDAERQRQARWQAARALPKPIVLDPQAQDAELLNLLDCPALQQAQKTALISLFAYDTIRPAGRLRMLGDAYARALGAAGQQEPYCGYEGLYEN